MTARLYLQAWKLDDHGAYDTFSMMPFLDLRHIAWDSALVQQLPPGMATFYEVLPVAREGDSVTVAMSHPENVTALSVLTQLFHAAIVPIRTDGAALRAMLQQLYLGEPTQAHGTLAWLPAALQPAWTAMLATLGLANGGLANGVAAEGQATEGQTTEIPVIALNAEQVDVDALLAIARGGNYQLTLCQLPQAAQQAALLREIHAPLWLTPAGPVALRRILLVMRGFASDEVALKWVIRLAASNPHTSVTLLPLLGQAPWGVVNYLQQQGPAQERVTSFALRLSAEGINAMLTLQSGEPRRQVVQALRQRTFDLVVMAAEGHGHLVGQVLADLEEEETVPPGGVLVLKPSAAGGAGG